MTYLSTFVDSLLTDVRIIVYYLYTDVDKVAASKFVASYRSLERDRFFSVNLLQ
ncbi:hypothetical protein [Nostoc sp. T09]|uniref:hypothetical protein n=1 Tax=Nostoc sp. T09 TaxID=1932621 RepID=UPI0015C510EB|nr:hypothetical protein [Nostoc sp. T09]